MLFRSQWAADEIERLRREVLLAHERIEDLEIAADAAKIPQVRVDRPHFDCRPHLDLPPEHV